MSSNTSEDSANTPTQANEDEGGLLPALLVGGAIIAVVALLIFWPGGRDGADGADGEGSRSGEAAALAEGGPGGVRGGVQARAVDEPSRPRPEPRINPRIQLPKNSGIAPAPPPEPDEPPEFDNVEDEIAWYEQKLDAAIRMRDSRQKFKDRLPKIRERIEKSDNPDEALQAFESRKKIVEDNFDKAQKRVDELESKLADLR